jgi:hypothetical protein
MQENATVFNNIPYKSKALKGASLLPEHAQEAIEDILNDTSIFLNMPKVSHILKARSESVYGAHKLVIILKEGVSYPEYMLSARVVALAPKLITIFFETDGFQEEEEAFMQMQYVMTPPPREMQTAQMPQSEAPSSSTDVSIISKTREALGITYLELGEEIGYDAAELTKALSQGSISKAMQKSLELCLENEKLKKRD